MTPDRMVTYCSSIQSVDGALEPRLRGRWRRSSPVDLRVGPADAEGRWHAGQSVHRTRGTDREGG